LVRRIDQSGLEHQPDRGHHLFGLGLEGEEFHQIAGIALGTPIRVERNLGLIMLGQAPDNHPGFVDTDGQWLIDK